MGKRQKGGNGVGKRTSLSLHLEVVESSKLAGATRPATKASLVD